MGFVLGGESSNESNENELEDPDDLGGSSKQCLSLVFLRLLPFTKRLRGKAPSGWDLPSEGLLLVLSKLSDDSELDSLSCFFLRPTYACLTNGCLISIVFLAGSSRSFVKRCESSTEGLSYEVSSRIGPRK